MGIIDKLNKPVFLKESSDTTEFVKRLEVLQLNASAKHKDLIAKEIKWHP